MKLYRYSDIWAEDGVRICESFYQVIKKTPCGYWVSTYDNREIRVETPEDVAYHMQIERGCRVRARFVLSGAGKRFCHETKALAMKGFRHRKIAQMRFAHASLKKAKQSLKAADTLLTLGDCLPRCSWTGSIMAGEPPIEPVGFNL